MEPTHTRVRVEVCVTSAAEARAAEAAGADTVELCSALADGGVTPGIGLVERLVRTLRIPVRVLVRPRAGDFVYDAADRAVLEAEVRGLLRLPAPPHIVTGSLTAEGLPDRDWMAAVQRAAPNAGITFHRAIDHARDPSAALELCLEAGVRRILTSGGAARAVAGEAVLAAMAERARRSGAVVAAVGGIGPADVVRLVERTGVQEVHFAAQRRMPAIASGKPSLSSGGDTNAFIVVPDAAKIEGVLEALDKAGLR
ncbi:MAG: copper homeostasis protein CutC [Bacteroidetes bacterium]|nr:copper homeostasis protein CutC [Bacteroidota bacterium]